MAFPSLNGPYEVQKFINMINFVFRECVSGLYFKYSFLTPLCTHTMVSSVIFLVDLVGTERWVV